MVHFTFKNGLAGKSLSAHNSFKSFIIMVVMLVLTTSSAFAEEIDGLNYKLDSETKTAILIPKTNGKYAGDIVVPGKIKGTDGAEYSVVTLGAECFSACYNLSSIPIPSTVTVIGVRCFKECGSLTSIVIPSSVSSLGEGCFKNCNSLTSINIPSSVTSLGYECFSGCKGLTSITIPSSVTSLGQRCFSSSTKLESMYFKGKCPYSISDAEIPKACIIYVPAEYLQDYKDALGSDYKYIYTWNPNGSDDDDKPVAPCATPSVFYGAGKLKFSCETAGAKYHYTISDKDMATDALSEDGNVFLSAAYDISVYATADGYKTSEKAKATLYWINANLDNGTNINQVRTRGVVASAHDGIISLSGLDDGEIVKFFAADGKYLGSTVAANGAASYAVSESLVIAKVGKDSIKIAMK